MSVAVRSTSSAANQTGATFSVTKPTGTVDGDLLVAIQTAALGGGSAPAAPSGWSQAGTTLTWGAGTDALQVFYKVASGEGASWTFNAPSGGLGNTSVYVFCCSGAASAPEANPVTGSGLSTTADPGAYTTTNANDLILTGWTNAGAATITPDASYTALGTLSGTCPLNAGSKAQAAAAAVANRTATIGSSVSWGAVLVAIKAAGVAPTASFTRSPASGAPGAVVTITDTSTGTPTSWDYDWGDGSTHATTQNPTHTYTRPGTYTITQTATNASGSTQATATVTITSGGSASHAVSGKKRAGGISRRRRRM